MPDYPTNVPPAGWYTDPSNAAQERWWGGVEWTHDVRPLVAPVAPVAPVYAPPVLLDVPGGGINPFAAIDAQEASWGAPDPTTALGAPSASGFSSFDSYATAAPASDPFAVAASWQDPGRRFTPGPPPTNGYATAGLVLSLVWLQLFGIIFSIIGLVRAANFERQGELPVGRKRAMWGLALGIVTPLVVGVLSAIAVPIFLGQQQAALDAQQQAIAENLGVTQDELLLEADGSPVTYNRGEYEQTFIESFTESAGAAPDWVACPDSVDMVVGVEITCQFAFQAVNHEMSITFVDNEGTTITTLDGAPVQQ